MGFVVIWEFKVQPGREAVFEAAYGQNGEWARLFRNDEAYIRTEFIRNLSKPDHYWALDFWRSEEAYEDFRRKRHDEYARIDAICGNFTESEREIGRFRTLE